MADPRMRRLVNGLQEDLHRILNQHDRDSDETALKKELVGRLIRAADELDEFMPTRRVTEVQEYGLSIAPPTGFWHTEGGKNEARRRIDTFRLENARFPRPGEFVALGINPLYLRFRGDSHVKMLKYLEYTEEEIADATRRRELRSHGSVETSTEPAMGSAAPITNEVVTPSVARKEPDPAVAAALSDLDQQRAGMISRYGVNKAAPSGFWKTSEGFYEAQRRTLEFIKRNHEKSPTPAQFQLDLGLNGFYNAYVGVIGRGKRMSYSRMLNWLVTGTDTAS